jgi:tetratricopeptide (TPR) repeat protein
MKPVSSLTRGLATVRRDWRAGRYAEAFQQATRLLDLWPDNPHLLVLWSSLVQLQDSQAPPLKKAEAALERAAALDEESPEPWFELATFADAVSDDPSTATRHYEKAITLSKRFLVEALLGKAKALSQLDRKQEALACVAEAYGVQHAHNGKMADTQTGDILERLEELARTK